MIDGDLKMLVNDASPGLCLECFQNDWSRDGICDQCFQNVLNWITVNVTEKLGDNESNQLPTTEEIVNAA